MVVMLRTLGIPARLATGYAVSEYDLNIHRYVIREKNAESWPEVYFPAYGWVEFSPFGGAPLVTRPFSGDTTGAEASDPNTFPGDASPASAGRLRRRDSTGSRRRRIDVERAPHPFNWLPLSDIALSLFAVVLIGAGIVRFAWEWGVRGLDYPCVHVGKDGTARAAAR